MAPMAAQTTCSGLEKLVSAKTAQGRFGCRGCRCCSVADRVGLPCVRVLQRHLIIAEVADRHPTARSVSAVLVAAAGDETLDVHHRALDRLVRAASRVGAGCRRGTLDNGSQSVLGNETIWALLSRSTVTPGLRVLDDVDDVAAAVGQDAAQVGELFDGLAQCIAVALHCGGGAK